MISTTPGDPPAPAVFAEYNNDNNIIIIITITQNNNARAPVYVYNIHILLYVYIRVSVRDRILRRPLCSPIVIKRNFRRVTFVGDERPQESL